MSETNKLPISQVNLKRSSNALILLLILGSGTVLRLRGLGYQSLWYDETQVRMLAYIPRAHLFEALAPYENAPPPYFVFIQAWMKAFGKSEFSMRLPSAIFGIISIALIYFLAKLVAMKSTRQQFIAYAAATLLAFSRFHIAYCQEARPYSMVFMLALISCYAFVRLLHDRRAVWQWAYVIATVCMFWTHPYSLWIFVSQCFFLGIYVNLKHEREGLSIRRWISLLALVALIFFPWLDTAQNLMHGSTIWMPRPIWSNVAPPFLGIGMACACSLGLLMLSVVYCIKTKDLRCVFVWLIAGLPVAVPILLSQGRYPFFVPRYGLWAIAGVYIAMAFGLATLPNRWALIALLAFLAVQSPPVLADFRDKMNMQVKANVRDAAKLIRGSANHSDRFYCTSDLTAFTLRDYLRDTEVRELERFDDPMAISGVKRIWLLESPVSDRSTGQRALARTEKTFAPFEIRSEWHFTGLYLYELVRKNESSVIP